MARPSIAEVLELAAKRLEARDWRTHWEDGRITAGWLVGATFVNDLGREYAARTAFEDWWSPGEFRADGLRTNETAGEKGVRLGPDAAAAAIREFLATQLQEA